MAPEGLTPRVLVAYDHNSGNAFSGVREDAWPSEDGLAITLSQWRQQLRRRSKRDSNPSRTSMVNDRDEFDSFDPVLCFRVITWPPMEALPPNLSTYAIVCLCLHNGGYPKDYEAFVGACQKSGAIPVGVCDSFYYPSTQVVPDIEGLHRCFSNDLHDVLRMLLKGYR